MLYHRLHCHRDSSRLVGFGKGLGGCLNRGLVQLLSKASSPALGHHKREAHCFETLKRGRAKSQGTRYWLKGRLLMQRGTAGIQAPDSPESAALFKAREAAEESQPRADRELAALPNTRMPQHLPRCRGLVALRSSAPLPLPPRQGRHPSIPSQHPRQAPAGPNPTSQGEAFPNQPDIPRALRGCGPGTAVTVRAGTAGLLCPGRSRRDCRCSAARILPPTAPRDTHPPASRWSSVLGCDMARPWCPQPAPGGAAAEGAGGALRAEVPGVAHTAPLALPLKTNEQLLPKPPNRPPNLNKLDFVLQVGKPR